MRQVSNLRIALLTVVAVVVVTLAMGGVQAAHESRHNTFGESGVVTVDQPDGVTYFTEELDNEYDDPVVIMKPVGEVGEQPAHIRVRDVQSQSFDYQIEEWSSTGGNTEDSGGHRPVDVSYLVLEAGEYSLDGQMVEAGTFKTDHNFTSQELSATFPTEPALFTQSQTENGPHQIVTRNQITYNSESNIEFQTRLQEEEGSDGNHAVETVGYVAVEQGTGSHNGVPFEVGKTPAVVEETNYNIDFENQYSSSGRFIADIQTYNGQDTAQPRLSSLSSDSASIFIEEETTGDDETSHGGSESIGYFAFGDIDTFQTESNDSDEDTDSGSDDSDEDTDSGSDDSDEDTDSGSDDSDASSSNVQVEPLISYAPSAPEAGVQVAFDGTGSTASNVEIISYNWDFGDGETGSGPTVSHTYSESGGYNVELTVITDQGNSHTTTEPVSVEEPQSETSDDDDDSVTVTTPGFGLSSAIMSLGGLVYIFRRKFNMLD